MCVYVCVYLSIHLCSAAAAATVFVVCVLCITHKSSWIEWDEQREKNWEYLTERRSVSRSESESESKLVKIICVYIFHNTPINPPFIKQYRMNDFFICYFLCCSILSPSLSLFSSLPYSMSVYVKVTTIISKFLLLSKRVSIISISIHILHSQTKLFIPLTILVWFGSVSDAFDITITVISSYPPPPWFSHFKWQQQQWTQRNLGRKCKQNLITENAAHLNIVTVQMSASSKTNNLHLIITGWLFYLSKKKKKRKKRQTHRVCGIT